MPADKREIHPRQIRSFVVRSRTTERQRHALEYLKPKYELKLENGLADFDQIFGRSAEVMIDIGFGMGESLLAMAQEHPENNYVGVEIHPAGVAALLIGVESLKLSNVRIYTCDVVDVLNQCIKNESLSGAQILFPDPWPKKKHHKRRLIQTSFVALLEKKLKRKGILHLATDWEHYAMQMMEILSARESLENLYGIGKFTESEEFRPSTKFARRGKRLGYGVWDLRFKKL